MRYFLAIILPPVAVLLCGKPVQFLLNILLCLLGWIPGVIHAVLVVHDHMDNIRNKRLIHAIQGGR